MAPAAENFGREGFLEQNARRGCLNASFSAILRCCVLRGFRASAWRPRNLAAGVSDPAATPCTDLRNNRIRTKLKGKASPWL